MSDLGNNLVLVPAPTFQVGTATVGVQSRNFPSFDEFRKMVLKNPDETFYLYSVDFREYYSYELFCRNLIAHVHYATKSGEIDKYLNKSEDRMCICA